MTFKGEILHLKEEYTPSTDILKNGHYIYRLNKQYLARKTRKTWLFRLNIRSFGQIFFLLF